MASRWLARNEARSICPSSVVPCGRVRNSACVFISVVRNLSSRIRRMAAVDLVSLGERYKQQLKQTYETVREKGLNLKEVAVSTIQEGKAKFEEHRQQLQPQAAAIAEGYKNSIKDMETPVPANAHPFLLKTFMWTGVCLFFSAVARNISAIFLGVAVSSIFNTGTAALLTYVAFPAFVFMQLRKVQMSEVEREQVVLLASMAEGALVGALFSDRYSTIYGPPLFLFPLVAAILTHFVGTKEQVTGKRQVFLGALVGGALAAYVIYGFVFNFNFTYLLSVVLVGAAAAADLQLKVASIGRGDSSPQLEQWKSVVILTIAGALAHYIGSVHKDQAHKVAESSHPAK